MNSRYDIGQKVTIKPVDNVQPSSRECAIDSYVGKTGQVINYYWISPRMGEVFYIYAVRIGEGYKEIALYEDEIEALID